MLEAYKIGVSIAMTSNASQVLGVIARDMTGLGRHAKALEGALNLVKIAAMGAMTAMAGGAALAGMAKMVGHAKELVHQQALFREQLRHMPGMTPERLNAETAEATAQAYKTSRDILTSRLSGNFQSIRELVTVFGGVKEAMANLTTMTRAQAVLGSLLGKSGDEQVFQYAKALEMSGRAQDPAAFHSMLNQMVKASVASGGRVTGDDFLGTFKYGRTAAIGWGEGFVGGILPTLIQEMKSKSGSGGAGGPGNALQSAHQVVVAGAMTNKAAEAFNRLGMLDPSKVISTTTGAVKGVRPGGVVGAETFQDDPYEWVQKFLVPSLAKQGITDPKKVTEAVSHLFGNRTAQQIMVMFATQQGRFQKDAALNAGASGLDAYETLMKSDPNMKLEAFNAAVANLLTTLGGPLVDPAFEMLMKFTHAINAVTTWAEQNPMTVEILGKAAAGLAALAIAVGAFAVGTAAASALGLLTGPVGLLALAVGIQALGSSVSSFPPWLVNMLTGAAGGAAIGLRLGGAPGAGIGALLGGGVAGATGGAGAAASVLPNLNDRLNNANRDSYFNRFNKRPAPDPHPVTPGDLMNRMNYSPGGGGGPAVIRGDVYLDGQKMGQWIARNLAGQMGRPAAGPSAVDTRMTLVQPGGAFA